MTKETQKEESVKKPRFVVLENDIEVLKASKIELALERVQLLQMERKPLIILIDNKEKKSIRYCKLPHQKNYRVESGDYEKDSVLSPVAATPETEA